MGSGIIELESLAAEADAATGLARPHAASQQRGPHPLPLFLQLVLRTLGDDPTRLRLALRGIRAYQEHPYVPEPAPTQVVAQVGHARLLAYGGTGRPAVFVPSIVNSSAVLDLMPGRSLLRWLAGNGVRPLLLDWGAPTATDADMSIDGHITERLLPLLDALGEPVPIVGYCLGGTMALAAAQLAACSSLALIATPWHYSGMTVDQRGALTKLWGSIEPLARAGGLVPMDVLQPGFWEVNGERQVTKFETFALQDASHPDAAMFVAVEDWANGGPPLTRAAAEQLFVRFCREDDPGQARWRIDGTTVDPGRIAAPVLSIAATRDNLVPPHAMVGVGERRLIDGGHVGIILGKRAQDTLWSLLRDWLLG